MPLRKWQKVQTLSWEGSLRNVVRSSMFEVRGFTSYISHLTSNLLFMQIASYIDHTLLKPTSTLAEIEKLCNEALQYGFAAVCVPPPFIKTCKNILGSTKIKT